MASNKHFELGKIENFVRIKCHPEDKPKDKRKKANFRKLCKYFEIVDSHLTFKRMKFDNDRTILISQ